MTHFNKFNNIHQDVNRTNTSAMINNNIHQDVNRTNTSTMINNNIHQDVNRTNTSTMFNNNIHQDVNRTNPCAMFTSNAINNQSMQQTEEPSYAQYNTIPDTKLRQPLDSGALYNADVVHNNMLDNQNQQLHEIFNSLDVVHLPAKKKDSNMPVEKQLFCAWHYWFAVNFKTIMELREQGYSDEMLINEIIQVISNNYNLTTTTKRNTRRDTNIMGGGFVPWTQQY